MTGWNIAVYRIADEGLLRRLMTSADSTRDAYRPVLGTRVAVWQAGPYGLRWIQDAASHKGAGLLERECGYPHRYIVRAADFLKTFRERRPYEAPMFEYPQWVVPEESVLIPGYLGKTTVEQSALDDCANDEWLYCEAWDES